MNNLENSIREAIEKDLPRKVGEELQKRLILADKLEDENKRLTKNLAIKESENLALGRELGEHSTIDARLSKLEVAQKDLETRERNLEVSELKLKLEESEKRSTLSADFVKSLTRNTVFRNSIMGNRGGVGSPTTDQYGNLNYPVDNPANLTEIKEEK